MSNEVLVALITVIGTVTVNLITILPQLAASRKDTKKQYDASAKKMEELKAEMKTDIEKVQSQFNRYKASDDDRYAESVRARFLQFDDDLCDSARPWPKEGRWMQALLDCDTYERYLGAHPNFKNGIAEDSIDSIRGKYRFVKDHDLFGSVKA